MDPLAKRNVKKIEVLETVTENIDEFMTSGEGERPWEVFELTQGQDVRKWCDNPELIAGIMPNLRDLICNVYANYNLTVLDFGCYAGYLYDYLNKELGHINYTGIDINPDVIRAAQDMHKDEGMVRFFVGDVYNVPSIPRTEHFTYDVVCCYRLVIHLPYFEDIVHNLLMWSNNLVHIIFFLSDYDYCEKCLETNLDTGKGAVYFKRYISRKTVKEALDKLSVAHYVHTHLDSKYASLFIYKN